MHLLSAIDVHKHYASHTALRGVTLHVPERSIFGLLGPNGAGKTSLIRIITQITGADQGELRFMGEPLQPKHALQMGYLPEERGLYKKMRVGEQLLYLGQLKGLSKAEARSRLDYWVQRFGMEQWWKKQVGDLSKGMQQKVQFVATVLHKPSLIILDEPFSGFDPVNAGLIQAEIQRLAAEGATIIFSTHRMETVEELCDYIVMLHRAEKVLDGPKRAIKEQFRSHTYEVEVDRPLRLPLPDGCELLEQDPAQGRYRIRLADSGPNALLRAIMDQGATLRLLREHAPSMNDIFISLAQR
jgi:ABC-2 type transport system ATP-binding protein